jgi:hypothetical protein
MTIIGLGAGRRITLLTYTGNRATCSLRHIDYAIGSIRSSAYATGLAAGLIIDGLKFCFLILCLFFFIFIG